MKPQPILVTASALLIACGVAALFAPQEIAAALAGHGQATAPLVVQLLGTGLFALGFLDWFSRYSPIGGIYGRPVLLANFFYFFTVTATFARYAASSEDGRPAWFLALATGALAAWFAKILFRPAKIVAQ